MLPGLLLGTFLSVCTCWFHNMVTLPSRIVSTEFGTWPYQCLVSNFTLISLSSSSSSSSSLSSYLFSNEFCYNVQQHSGTKPTTSVPLQNLPVTNLGGSLSAYRYPGRFLWHHHLAGPERRVLFLILSYIGLFLCMLHLYYYFRNMRKSGSQIQICIVPANVTN
jgi:hypothetical protein